MPTDDERRRVAAALREKHRERTRPGQFEPQDVNLQAWCYLKDLESCVPDGDSLFTVLADLIEPEKVTGETSDGYHTFDELYDHRAKLFSVIVRGHRELAWKSRLHHDGTMYDGMFIVGVETPDGQATYHYDVDPYWDLFDCEVLDRAPEWDGHTPRQAIDRIAALGPSCDRDALLALAVECKLVSSVYGVMAPEAEGEELQELFFRLAERELKISNAIFKALRARNGER